MNEDSRNGEDDLTSASGDPMRKGGDTGRGSGDPRLPELYSRAAELDGADRARWLGALRAEEPDLAAEVERLLAAGEEHGARLETPAWKKLAVADVAGRAAMPERVGRYRIVREIGRGGMGRVFLAEQEDEAFRRTVALKILDRELLSEEVVRRFRDEVRILAPLAHPGIARFLDGGRAEDGTWFLALEYVEGVDLVEHARREALSADDRIRLFLAVLEAVEHAHRSAVVHRDLKPANILVGGDGRPRLLDFGISKLVDPAAGDGMATTRTESRILTPAYASPEQFRGARASVASDVYSLGVVLYELLCGVHPHRSASGSRGELERAVLDVDPEPPSTAARRREESGDDRPERPAALRWSVDVDAICLKALRKEPERRYPTAQAFADDLRRYLAGLPVEARRGGLRYRLGKLAGRRRNEIAAAAATALALVAILYAARVELRASRTRTPEASGRPAASPSPASKPFPIERRVDLTIEELERRFAAAPDSVQTGSELVAGLVRVGRTSEAAVVVGRMRQLPGAADDPLVDYIESTVAINLDEPQRALALATRALEGALRTGRGELVARIRGGRARLLSDLGQQREALAEQEIALQEAEAAGDHGTLSRTYNDLAVAKLSSGDLVAGERLLERALDSSRAAGDVVSVGINLHNLGGLAAARDRPALAAERYREAIEIFRQVEGRRQRAVTLGDLADILRELGRTDEVKPLRDEALAIARELSDETTVAFLLYYRAAQDLESARLRRVDAAAAEIETLSRTSGTRTSLALAELLRGAVAAARGELGGARAKLGDAVRILHDDGEADWAADARLAAAELELADGRPPAAVELARAVVADFESAGDNRYRFRAEAILARAAVRGGRLDDAERWRGSLAPEVDRQRSLSSRLAALSARAELDRAAGRHDDARGHLRVSIELSRTAERKLAELRARLTLAELDLDGGRATSASSEARAIAAESSRLGLRALEASALRLERMASTAL